MNTRLLITLSALALATLPVRAAGQQPNILLVLSDDHSATHLGCYGNSNVITPKLDAFAAEGMRFTRAHTTAPQCAPSRSSIFFGRSPVALGTARFAQPAAPHHVAFTDVLRRHGYWVGIDGRHHHLDGKRKEEPHVAEALESAGLKYLEERFDHVRILSTKSVPEMAAVPVRLGEALDKVPAGKPFFLYFGTSQAHRAWPARHDQAKFDPARLVLQPDWPDLPELRLDYARYLTSVRDLDRIFGLMMATLQDRGLAGNTLVVFMGDNGDSILRDKGTLYSRGTHVPLIVRWPGVVTPGTRSDLLVSGEDLAATLLGAAGLEPPREMTSVSFLPALQGRPFAGRKHVFAERGWHHGPITRTDGLDLSRAIESKTHRLIYHVLPERAYTPIDGTDGPAWQAIRRARAAKALSPLHERLFFASPRPVFELFDVQRDPHGLENLAGQPAFEAIETELRNELARWMVREADFLPLPSLRYPKE